MLIVGLVVPGAARESADFEAQEMNGLPIIAR
jgi:hypothetical protein